MSRALDTLGRADPRFLWLAAVAFAVSLVGSAGCWRAAIALCGGRTSLADATARYGAGSLANTFVPARAGDAVRFALFSKLVPGQHKLWTTGGAFVAVAATRAAMLGGIVATGAALGVVPWWPLFIAAALVAVAVVLARRAHRHLGPRDIARLAAWVALSVAGRFAGAAAVSAAVGIQRPFLAALLILPALDVSGLVPLTPGNVGIASAAIAIAFRSHGVSFNHGLAAGITLQALETAVGVIVGTASVLWLAPYPSPGMRRVALGSAAVAVGLGATALVSLTAG